MEIKILGTGCPNCKTLENNVRLAVDKAWIEAQITKVTEMADIMEYNILWTPGLVINDIVISSWKVLSPEEIEKLLEWKIWDNDWTSPKNCGCSCGWKC